MDPRVVGLLRRLAEIESGEEIATTVLGGGRRETVRRPHAEVTELRPEAGVLAVRHGTRVARLHLPEAEALALLATAAEDASAAWGEPLSAEEGAARLLSVWLDESVATREPHPTGWWTYRGAGFDPLPPWEAHRGRRA
ncbi:hypothetical protein [Geodermatophilus sp. SYSU D00815]